MPEEVLLRSILADRVRERLLEGILNGSYPPDSRIVETAVAKSLGTSQAPVREALRSLAALGVVEIVPFRGARVRRLQPEELLEAYVVRSDIEVLAVRLAVPRMSEDDIADLVKFGEKMQAAADAGDGRAVAQYDVCFHERIVELSGNRTLLRVWRSLEPFARTYLMLVMPGSDPTWSAGLHTPIVDAIRRHDVKDVRRAVERHFQEVSDALAARLDGADAGSASRSSKAARQPPPSPASTGTDAAAPSAEGRPTRGRRPPSSRETLQERSS